MGEYNRSHRFYLFAMKGGGKKLGYGKNAEDAFEVLSFWHTHEEMAQVIKDDFVRINQRDLKKHAHELR